MHCWPASIEPDRRPTRLTRLARLGGRMRLHGAAALTAGCLTATLCAAQTPHAPAPPAAPHATTPLRVDRMRHGQADRVVIWLKRGAPFAAHQQGNDLVLELPPATNLSPATGAPTESLKQAGKWVQGIESAPGSALARLRLAPGARPRVWPWPDRVVIDVDDTLPALRQGQYRPTAAPPRPATITAVVRPADDSAKPAAPLAGRLPVVQRPTNTAPGAVQIQVAPPLPAARPPTAQPPATPPPPAPPPPAAPPAAAAPADAATNPSIPPPPAPSAIVRPPLAASAVLLPPDTVPGGPSVLLPAERLTAAAAFIRHGELRVVFDAPRLLDLSQLKDDANFGSVTERLLPDGMELRMRPAPGIQPRLTRLDAGWALTLGTQDIAVPPVTAQLHGGVLALAAAAPGHVVVVEDEPTGGRLLVGPQRGRAQRVAGGHRAAEWVLLPSLQGVVVQPLSDRVLLQDKDAGFELKSADPPALALLWPDGPDTMGEGGRAMTRRFDLPGLPVPVLRRRLAEALRDAAMAPHTARTAPRLRVAEAMLACGLDEEAAAVLKVAALDDPAARTDPAVAGLAAMAAWLSARAGGVQPPPPAFDAAMLGPSDEAELWRALWGAGGGDSAAVAGTVAPRWRLLLDYPDHLRRPILPAVAELLARGGQDKALDALLAAFPEPSLDLARARRLQRQDKIQDSLVLLDRLAGGQDRLVRAQAMETATELRLSAHLLTPAAAADAFDHQFYAWRGGDRELRLRLRAADLRAQAGTWRKSLALLRETDGLFPGVHQQIHDAEIAVVSGLLHGNGASQQSALDLMALADDAAGLLGEADTDAALAPLLADRLLALDLPAQAEPVIRRLLDRAGTGAARGPLGLRLAQLVADRGDAPAALAVLDGSNDPPDGPAAEGRALLRARLLAATGHTADALSLLAGMPGHAPLEQQASLRESGHDWPGAALALRSALDGPDAAGISDQARRDLVLRAARDLGEAADMAGLRQLRATYQKLFAGSANTALFDVLTADPVARVDDLPRAGRELAAMQTLGKDLAPGTARRPP